MKISELRLGNWVDQPNDGVTRVTSILNDIQIRTETGHIDKYCRPIPLTEEWFLKFGFDEIIVEGYPIYQSDKGFMVEYYKDESVFLILDFEVRIKYVHQLQNLYFTLTGEELEINGINNK